jgi:hypothetical protein
MPKYVIERELPGAGQLSPQQLQAVSQTSCGVLRKLGPEMQWIHSYVTQEKIYCIYIAPNEALIQRQPNRNHVAADTSSGDDPLTSLNRHPQP